MTIHNGPERRNKPRIKQTFPANVRGVDSSGQLFETESAVENLSASGFYVRLPQLVEGGTRLSIVVQFTNNSSDKGSSARMAADGVVERAEALPDGSCGLGVLFTKCRFL
jgi:hypothetical protein